MENTKNVELEIYQLAVKLIQEGRSQEEVRLTLKEIGLDDYEASTVLHNITKYHKEEKSNKSGSNMTFGALWFIGGIIATAVSEGQVLFYGAIIAGAIQFIIGLSQSSSE